MTGRWFLYWNSLAGGIQKAAKREMVILPSGAVWIDLTAVDWSWVHSVHQLIVFTSVKLCPLRCARHKNGKNKSATLLCYPWPYLVVIPWDERFSNVIKIVRENKGKKVVFWLWKAGERCLSNWRGSRIFFFELLKAGGGSRGMEDEGMEKRPVSQQQEERGVLVVGRWERKPGVRVESLCRACYSRRHTLEPG